MFSDILLFFIIWTNLSACGPESCEIIILSLHKKLNTTITTMDSTLTSGKQLLFAYCITDGVLDEMTEEQKASIISIIESLLSEGEDANNERLLSGEKRN